MFSYQWEGGVIVIETYIAPATGVMARTTIGPEAATVLIIVCVTGITIRRCSLVPVRMTGFTRQVLVLPGQGETGF